MNAAGKARQKLQKFIKPWDRLLTGRKMVEFIYIDYHFQIKCCEGLFLDGTTAAHDDRCYWLFGNYGEEAS